MPEYRFHHWLSLLPLLHAGAIQAEPLNHSVVGDVGAGLVLLGALAILAGARNWRILRHKPPLSLRCRPGDSEDSG